MGLEKLLLHACKLRLGRVPDLDRVDVGADHVLEVRRHGPAVNLGPGAGLADALCDVKDDAREAVLVDPDFLVVGDLSQLAARRER
jgi:hypothetical protein